MDYCRLHHSMFKHSDSSHPFSSRVSQNAYRNRKQMSNNDKEIIELKSYKVTFNVLDHQSQKRLEYFFVRFCFYQECMKYVFAAIKKARDVAILRQFHYCMTEQSTNLCQQTRPCQYKTNMDAFQWETEMNGWPSGHRRTKFCTSRKKIGRIRNTRTKNQLKHLATHNMCPRIGP